MGRAQHEGLRGFSAVFYIKCLDQVSLLVQMAGNAYLTAPPRGGQ